MILKGLRAHLTGGAAAGRNLYLAFYRARGQANQAMDRVAASAELDGSTTGEKSDTSISQFIEPGLYFSALSAESNLMSFAGVAATAQLGSLSAMILGVNDSSMTSSVGVAGYYDDGPSYGVPPSTITPDGKPTTHQPVVEAKFELP